jgi:anthranilate phosphoribosyltransferase
VIYTALGKLARGQDLSCSDADEVMEEILSGQATDSQIVTLLAALRAKGETVEELVGFATAMRRHAAPVFPDPRAVPLLVDTCGTGGDGSGTFNISTCAAFVVAGAGARVAKHGNRSISSRCGSADLLEALGVHLDLPPQRMGQAVERIGIGFFFAPAVHTAMKHAVNARRKLKGRTVFNLLGPLTNPAGARAQVIGVPQPTFAPLLAQALAELGSERAFVVHGAGGLDEISISGETHVSELGIRSVASYMLMPDDFGLESAPVEEVAGGDVAANVEIQRAILAGERSACRDIVLANASAALVAAGIAADFLEGVRRAAYSVDSGAAHQKLVALAQFTEEARTASHPVAL